jgi:hypothetical protein
MHHLHFLLYVPTIAFIVALRYGLRPELSAGKAVYGLCLAAVLTAVFVVTALFGRMPVPIETYLAYVSARATHPINPDTAHLWYATLPQEMALTRMLFVHNALRFPVYAALIAVHIPVARYIGNLIAALPARPSHRRHRRTRRHHRRLRRHFRGHLRLLALGIELGGVHVSLHAGAQAYVPGEPGATRLRSAPAIRPTGSLAGSPPPFREWGRPFRFDGQFPALFPRKSREPRWQIRPVLTMFG